MFKKIVWATDGSESADGALELAKSLASRDGAELVVVHNIERIAARGAFTEDAEEDEHQLKVKRQAEEVAASGVPTRVQLIESLSGAAHRIAEVAEKEGADLIVVGTRGHNPFAGLLVGSVTQRLLHVAACPVLVVPST
jgi:nucleotide-binding universal stress UspA family protein